MVRLSLTAKIPEGENLGAVAVGMTTGTKGFGVGLADGGVMICCSTFFFDLAGAAGGASFTLPSLPHCKAVPFSVVVWMVLAAGMLVVRGKALGFFGNRVIVLGGRA